MIKAVITDLAGTTIDFGSCAPAGAFIELFRRHRIQVSPEQARVPMGLEKRAHIVAIASMPEIAQQWRSNHDGVDWTETDISALYAEFIPLQLKVLPAYGELIPGAVKLMRWCREQGIRVGATTGYNRDMLAVVLGCAAEQGFVPDSSCCAEDVPDGRPAPWMIYRCLQQLGVFPPAAVVNVGDTLPDVVSGRNAGSWSVGVLQSGNMLGLSRSELAALDAKVMAQRCATARTEMLKAGAHFVLDSIEQLPELIATINRKMAQGIKP
ncbi:phosphonoacetaldehyde hydrolase [Desulfuromusa kysingii]|uniref:Phosphonoacetaldehyde hydrolase n=1 Tax=Desulfuromusa kysingii TaxID=37625 RepID=A0A1H4DJ71_9BACT|nr:phosphonoacetaldehyde hydrolase [Desulfuromusa kysingii]SEA72831.1 phosphonoacetaldehyde hydrolase [Desulfuromusa kysingii]